MKNFVNFEVLDLIKHYNFNIDLFFHLRSFDMSNNLYQIFRYMKNSNETNCQLQSFRSR